MGKRVIVVKKFDGRAFAISVETEKQKDYANKALEKRIELYKEDKVLAGKEPEEYAWELAEEGAKKWNEEHVGICDRCKSKSIITKVNRMRAIGGLFWRDSRPAHYHQCKDCGNQFEIVEPTYPNPSFVYIRMAESRINSAKERLK